MYSSINWEVVGDVTPQSTFCTRIHAEYHNDKLCGYSVKARILENSALQKSGVSSRDASAANNPVKMLWEVREHYDEIYSTLLRCIAVDDIMRCWGKYDAHFLYFSFQMTFSFAQKLLHILMSVCLCIHLYVLIHLKKIFVQKSRKLIWWMDILTFPHLHHHQMTTWYLDLASMICWLLDLQEYWDRIKDSQMEWYDSNQIIAHLLHWTGCLLVSLQERAIIFIIEPWKIFQWFWILGTHLLVLRVHCHSSCLQESTFQTPLVDLILEQTNAEPYLSQNWQY